jgi:broad specificity phosphatase PhoE
MADYCQKDVEIVYSDDLWDNFQDLESRYNQILADHSGKNILIVAHKQTFVTLRNNL